MIQESSNNILIYYMRDTTHDVSPNC